MSESKINEKTTCTKKEYDPILPPPPATLVAEIVGVSTDYVKKINSGSRSANTEKGNLVKYCNELIVDGQTELIKAVKAVITKKQSTTV